MHILLLLDLINATTSLLPWLAELRTEHVQPLPTTKSGGTPQLGPNLPLAYTLCRPLSGLPQGTACPLLNTPLTPTSAMTSRPAATVLLFHKPLSPELATKILVLHQKAFSHSACTACPGLCCKDCASSDGYLYGDDVPPETIEHLKRKFNFDPKHGFKATDGCKLPLHLRSTTCAAFHCTSSAPHNSFARNIVKHRDKQLPHIKPLDTPETLSHVEKLHSLMSDTYLP